MASASAILFLWRHFNKDARERRLRFGLPPACLGSAFPQRSTLNHFQLVCLSNYTGTGRTKTVALLIQHRVKPPVVLMSAITGLVTSSRIGTHLTWPYGREEQLGMLSLSSITEAKYISIRFTGPEGCFTPAAAELYTIEESR